MKITLEQIRGNRGTGSMRPVGSNMLSGTMTSGGLTSDGKPRTDFFGKEGDKIESIQPRWKLKTEDEIRTGPTIFKTMVYVGSWSLSISMAWCQRNH